MTFEEFCELLQVDLALGLGEIESMADHRIRNTDSVDVLRARSDEVLRTIAAKAMELYE